MNVTEIKINTTKLKNDAGTIKTSMDTMNRKIDAMKVKVQALSSMWEGDAKQAFDKEFQNDIKLALECLKEINALYNYETFARETYDNCEKQVLDLIGNLKV